MCLCGLVVSFSGVHARVQHLSLLLSWSLICVSLISSCGWFAIGVDDSTQNENLYQFNLHGSFEEFVASCIGSEVALKFSSSQASTGFGNVAPAPTTDGSETIAIRGTFSISIRLDTKLASLLLICLAPNYFISYAINRTSYPNRVHWSSLSRERQNHISRPYSLRTDLWWWNTARSSQQNPAATIHGSFYAGATSLSGVFGLMKGSDAAKQNLD